MAIIKEHVLTISTDMWVPVEDPSFQSKFKAENSSPNTSFKFRVPVEDSYQSHYQTVRELQILQSYSPRTALMQRNKLKLTQQKREEPNSAETIHI